MNKFEFIFFIKDKLDSKTFFLIIRNCINQNIIINYKNHIWVHQFCCCYKLIRRMDKNVQVHAHIIFVIFIILSLKISLCFTNTYKFKNYCNNSSFTKLDLITVSPSRKGVFNQQSLVIRFQTFNLSSVQ